MPRALSAFEVDEATRLEVRRAKLDFKDKRTSNNRNVS